MVRLRLANWSTSMSGMAILKGSLAGPTGMWCRTERGSTEVIQMVLPCMGGDTRVNHVFQARYPKHRRNNDTRTDTLHTPYAGRNGTRAAIATLPVPIPGSQFGNDLAVSPKSQRSQTQTAPIPVLLSPGRKDAGGCLGPPRPGPSGPTKCITCVSIP